MECTRSPGDVGAWPNALHAEQVRSSYAHLPLTLAVFAVNAALVTFVLGPVTPTRAASAWFVAAMSLVVVRTVCWLAHRVLDKGPQIAPVWTAIAIVGSLASGILWGSIPWVFSPLDEPHLLFVALVIAGMCAGAVTVHAAHAPTAIAFIVPASLPLGITLLMQSGNLQIIAGLMTCLFAVSLCVITMTFRRWFNTVTVTRLSLAHQTEALLEANKRLLSEVESHQSTAAKLQHAQKLEAIGRLTAGIAHDFNNVLMAAGGAAELSLRHLPDGSPALPYIGTIRTAVDRAALLTQHLLAFGRVQTLQPRVLDVNEVVRGMAGLLTTTLGGLGTLVVRTDAESVPALVDQSQLEQAILNLVINARDAMPGSGIINVSTGHGDRPDGAATHLANRFIWIAVADNGHGMTEEDRQRAFDPFFTTKDIGKGSGLGLSQVYGLAKQSGGVAQIESAVGRGTTVRIWLPQAAADGLSPPIAPRRAPEVAGCSGAPVLLLEDDAEVRRAVEGMLTGAGYAVTSYESGRDALESLQGPDPVALMVVDYAMPVMRGDAFAAEARRVRADVPIVFITGYADPDVIRSERWVLRKPFRGEELVEMAEQALQQVTPA